MKTRTGLVTLLSVALLSGCGDDDGTEVDAGAGDGAAIDGAGDAASPADAAVDSVADAGESTLETVWLEPRNTVLEVDVDTVGTVAYQVWGRFADGTSKAITDRVDSWAVSNPLVGAMNGTSLETLTFAETSVATTLVTASVGELEGSAQLTVVAYRKTGPEQETLFVLPYADTTGPQTASLVLSTAVRKLDVFFNVDTTGSMGSPIANLQSSLVSTVVPGITIQVPDTYFGVGSFEDFPLAPFGEASCNYFGPSDPDQPFTLLAEMTSVIPDVQCCRPRTAASRLPARRLPRSPRADSWA